MLVPTSAQASAPPRSRGRARSGGGAAAGDPAAARAFIRLDHERVSTRNRRRGGHRHDPCAARADDARQRRPRPLRPGRAEQTGGSAARRTRPPAPLTQPLLEIAAATPCRRHGRWCSNASARHVGGRWPLRREAAACRYRPSSSQARASTATITSCQAPASPANRQSRSGWPGPAPATARRARSGNGVILLAVSCEIVRGGS